MRSDGHKGRLVCQQWQLSGTVWVCCLSAACAVSWWQPWSYWISQGNPWHAGAGGSSRRSSAGQGRILYCVHMGPGFTGDASRASLSYCSLSGSWPGAESRPCWCDNGHSVGSFICMSISPGSWRRYQSSAVAECSSAAPFGWIDLIHLVCKPLLGWLAMSTHISLTLCCSRLPFSSFLCCLHFFLGSSSSPVIRDCLAFYFELAQFF